MTPDNTTTVEVAEIVFARTRAPADLQAVYRVTCQLMPRPIEMGEFARVIAWLNLAGLVTMTHYETGTTIQRTDEGAVMARVYSDMQREAMAHKQRMVALMRGEAWS